MRNVIDLRLKKTNHAVGASGLVDRIFLQCACRKSANAVRLLGKHVGDDVAVLRASSPVDWAEIVRIVACLAAEAGPLNAARSPDGEAPTGCEPALRRVQSPQRPAVTPRKGERFGPRSSRTVTFVYLAPLGKGPGGARSCRAA